MIPETAQRLRSLAVEADATAGALCVDRLMPSYQRDVWTRRWTEIAQSLRDAEALLVRAEGVERSAQPTESEVMPSDSERQAPQPLRAGAALSTGAQVNAGAQHPVENTATLASRGVTRLRALREQMKHVRKVKMHDLGDPNAVEDWRVEEWVSDLDAVLVDLREQEPPIVPDAARAINDQVAEGTASELTEVLRAIWRGTPNHPDLRKQLQQRVFDMANAALPERRAAPQEQSAEHEAIERMFKAYQDLKALGWNDAIYCPKDGSHFLSVEPGSTGVHDTNYEGEWPKGTWWIFDHDMWPARPCLFKLKPAERRSDPAPPATEERP